MKKIMNQVKRSLKNERGDILQWVIVIVVVIAISLAVMPSISNKIQAKGISAADRLDSIDSLITPAP